MALNPELVKLIGLIVGGLLVGGIGQYIIIKKKKAAQEYDYSSFQSDSAFSESSGDFSNDSIKTYIEQYKSSYPRDSIKTALLNSGNSESEVERYLVKFFD